MASKQSHIFLSLVLFVGLFVIAKAKEEPSHIPIDLVRRSSFPKGFVFGSASSAYQVTKQKKKKKKSISFS